MTPTTHKNRNDRVAYESWLDLCRRIEETTQVGGGYETDQQRQARKEKLKGDFCAFCRYYFPDFIDSDFGWFHKKAAKDISENENLSIVLEWAREHAKSIFADLFIPLWLYAKDEIKGMVVVSSSSDKAKGLLGDIQAQFVANQKWIADYGELAKIGDWSEGKFTTIDGIGFWALGRGQSPRGIRKAAKRPNYCVIDDIDDDEIVLNESRVDKALNWVLRSLYNALPIHGKRVVWAGNRMHRKSILAKYVGDYEPGLQVREGIIHSKVYAVENPRTHGKADFLSGKPAWKERYTLAQLQARAKEIGMVHFNAEFQHEHLVEGVLFKPEWQHWFATPPIKHFKYIISYCDSSMGAAKTSDYKANVVIGVLHEKYNYPYRFHILDGFCRQCSNSVLIKHIFDVYDKYGQTATYMVEVNSLQKHGTWKLLLQDIEAEEKKRGYSLPIRPDARKKPDKDQRIESLVGLFERGLVSWAMEKRGGHDFEAAWEQFLAFPQGYKDFPDATEGAIYHANRRSNGSLYTAKKARPVRSDRNTM